MHCERRVRRALDRTMAEGALLDFVLVQMCKDELREVANYFGLVRSGTKAEIRERISFLLEGDLEGMVSPRGPWYRDQWNDFVEDVLDGRRRRSFEKIRHEVKLLYRETNQPDEGATELRACNVATVFREDRVDELADLAGLSRRTVLRRLRKAHGNKSIRLLFGLEPPEEPDDIKGLRIVNERYKIIRALGEGGFGSAYAALDLKNPHRSQVVLKYSNDQDDDEFLRREIAKAFDLAHQGICRYYDYDEEIVEGDRRVPFLVIEYGGESLEGHFEQLDPDERFSRRFAYRVVRQVSVALDYAADEHQLVHGDVNPGNILIGEDEEVRLADFGLAARLIPARTSGGRRTLKGTSHLGMHQVFSAPEVLAGRRARRSSDQYSLAVVFCAMMEGQLSDRPYRRKDLGLLTKKQNAALERAMELDPRNRFPTCRRFAKALCGR